MANKIGSTPHLSMIAPPRLIQPSIELELSPNGVGVAVVISFPSQLMAFINDGDLVELHRVAGRMLNAMRALSQGPLKLKQLAALGHPYGYNQGEKGKKTPRFVPEFMDAGGKVRKRFEKRQGAAQHSLIHIPGVKGTVPKMEVVNKQSGKLLNSYSHVISRAPEKVVLRLQNHAEHSPYLAFGTVKMQAHGPWTYVPTRFQPQLAAAFNVVQAIAWSRYQAEQAVGGVLRIG